jgi:flagellar hook-associated protein 2
MSLGRDGVVTFDRAKFLAAYQSDPAAVTAAFTSGGAGTADDGIAERLRLVSEAATDSVTGTITTAIAGRKSLIADFDDQIEAWSDRLALREQALRKQFSNLETMLGRLRNQSSWLAGQVSTLGGGA